jgi:hypothetical protein
MTAMATPHQQHQCFDMVRSVGHRRRVTWLMDKEMLTEDMMMKMLSSHLSSCVTSWQAYDVNGYTYYTKEKDKKSVA